MATVGYQQQFFYELTAIPASDASATHVSSTGRLFLHGPGPRCLGKIRSHRARNSHA